MKQLIRVMKALSDPNRLRILKLLEGGELCVCEIQKVLELAQSTVSRHMKLLEDADLVTRRRQGTWMLYRLAAAGENPYAKTMLERLAGWLEDDATLHRMRQALPEAAVLRGCTPEKQEKRKNNGTHSTDRMRLNPGQYRPGGR